MARRGSSLGRSVLDLDVDDSRFHTKLAAARTAAQKWTDATGSDLTKAGKAITGVGESWTRNVTLPIVGAGVATGKLAFDFDKTMSQIVALTAVGQDEIGGFREEILTLGPAIGRSPQELAEAFYFVASAGFEGAEAMEILRNTAKAAAAGLGDTSTVAKVIGSAVNAYGLEAKDAAVLTDQLVAAIGEGSAEAPEFAGALGNVIGSAAQIGASFSDVTGAIAAMTNVGIGAEEAVTSLNQVFVTLFKPTKEAAEALADVGYTAEGLRTSIRERGLMATLGELAGRLDGNAEATAEVFGNVRALRGVLALTGPQLEETSALIDRVADSAGATGRAFDEVAQSPSFRLEQAMARLEAVGIELGADVLPVVVDILEALAEGASDLAEWWDSLDDGTRDLIVRVLAFTAAAGPALIIIGKVTTGLGALFKTVGFLIGPKGVPALSRAIGPAGLIGVLAALAFALSEGSKHFADWTQDVIHGRKAANEIRSIRDALSDLGDMAPVAAAQLISWGIDLEEWARLVERAGGDVQLAWEELQASGGDLGKALMSLDESMGTLGVTFGRVPPEIADALADGEEDVQAGAAAMLDGVDEEAAAARASALEQMKAMLSGIAALFDSDESLREAFQNLLDRMDDPYTEAERRADIFSQNTITLIRKALQSGDPLIEHDAAVLVENMLGQIEAMEPGALATGEAVPKKLREGMNRQVGAMIAWVEEHVTGQSLTALTLDEANDLGFGNLWRYAQGMERARREKVAHQLNQLQADLRTQTSVNLWQSGKNAVDTLAQGMIDNEATLKAAAARVGTWIGSGLAIYSEPEAAWSPLRGITQWGGNIVDTIAAGILAESGVIPSAIRGALAGDMLAVPEVRLPWSQAMAAASHPYAGPAGAVGGRQDPPAAPRVIHVHLEDRIVVRSPEDIARALRRAEYTGMLDG